MKKLVWLGLVITAVFLAGSCSPTETPVRAAATTYYVATDGDNNNPGTLAEPWGTIQYAADNIAAGDTVLVRGGIYEEAVTINISGTAADGDVTFMSYTGETAVLDGSNLTVPNSDSALFLIDSQSYVTIDGFELRNYRTTNSSRVPMGLYVAGSAHHITLQNNTIHQIETNAGANGNAHGIAVYGTEAAPAITDVIISNNELYDLKLGNSEALVLNGNVANFLIEGNLVHDNDNIGIDLIGFEGTAPDTAVDQARDGVVRGNTVYNIDTLNNPAYGGEQSAAGIYVDGGTRITIEQNQVYQSNFGIEIASEHSGRATSEIIVRNNLLYHNHNAGLAMGGYDTNRGSTEACAILNNTFFENDSNQTGSGELYVQFDTQNNVIKNNIFYANAQNLFMSNEYTQNSGNVLDSNLFFAADGAAVGEWQWKNVYYQGFTAYQTGTGNDANSLFANPLLASTSLPDLHLLTNSPAIDAGENLAESGSVDFAGGGRVNNGRIDIGAYEFLALTESLFLPLAQK
ncbi:MAG: right-handed parallel beta-helix repeat-containing protein [Ardenticatenaceae bacterium]|nr:right-handed parallel beta-helix repeat-containing protein [Ardenticatenaceae bacterium]